MLRTVHNEGLGFARLLMVLSSMSSMTPLFILWGVRGIAAIPDQWIIPVCAVLVVGPNLILLLRLKTALSRRDTKMLTVGVADDHRDHLLVYLFAMLIPLYDANIDSARDAAATVIAFLFVVFLFWHLNLHYMNLAFALFKYRVYTIHPSSTPSSFTGRQPFVLLTKRTFIESGQQIIAYRISNTVFFEVGGSDESRL